ncbi:hypothetical protein ACFFRR_006048 [Megaselia abdita]
MEIRAPRPRRNRQWQLGIIFLIYSLMAVLSQETSESKESTNVNDYVSPEPNPEEFTLGTNEEDEEHESTTFPTTTTKKPRHPYPTWRPLRDNCTPPAIEQFPRPIMGPWLRRHGGLILHVAVAVFTFFGLAIVCDDYFVASLDRICEEMKLSPDVAGATFMAAGSSAPELATVIIGVFFAKDDIGVSGVIGSAVFNIMFVISVCALASGTVCKLNWWPLVRDCFFYCLSILIMFIVIFNDVISWFEALIMLLFYVVYCVAMYFNESLERWAMSLNLPIKLPTKEEQSALVTYKNMQDTSYTNGQQQTNLSENEAQTPQQQQQPKPPQQQQEYQGYNEGGWDPNSAWGEGSAPAQPPVTTTSFGGTAPGAGGDNWGNDQWNQVEGQGQQNYAYNADQPDASQTEPTAKPTEGGQTADYYKSKDTKTQEQKPNPLEPPTTGGQFALISWYVVYPIHFTCQKTIFDCRTEKYRNWYPFTFLMSMVWISFYSYIMVWMITIIGSTLGIPDTVMGLTFVAAGVSVPDALSSVAVIKEGFGDMAVSNAVGSNVFDILVCLGLPWFIQTAIIKPGTHVNVISKGLIYSTLSLFSTVVFLLLSTHLNGWKLDKRLGVILMVWYVLFITLAALYELNVFGYLNPPECPSKY